MKSTETALTVAVALIALTGTVASATTALELRTYPGSRANCTGAPIVIKRTRTTSDDSATCSESPLKAAICTADASDVVPTNHKSKLCIDSITDPLALTSDTDVYAAINILTNATDLACNEAERMESTAFYLADGKCNNVDADKNTFVRATCQRDGDVDVRMCVDSACKNCTQTVQGKDGQCSSGLLSETGGDLLAQGVGYYVQCFTAPGAKGSPEDGGDTDKQGEGEATPVVNQDPKRGGSAGRAAIAGSIVASGAVMAGALLFL